jgi:hypothetical protein
MQAFDSCVLVLRRTRSELDTTPVVDYMPLRNYREERVGKRNRTQQRFDELYELAVRCHMNGWTDKMADDEFQCWAIKNPDLVDENAITTARSEFRKMAHPRLSASLPLVRALAQAIMDNEPPGTNRRFNHEFFKICRFARDHEVSVSAALRDYASHKP